MARKPAKTAAKGRWPEITSEAAVASVAVFLFVLTLATSAWFALRGSVVTAVPPTDVFIYRDKGNGAVLTIGVDTALVNSASANYGDVVTRVTMEIDGPEAVKPSFNYQTLFTPVFTQDAAKQALGCPVDARCVANDQFLAIEETRRTLDVPGGSSRSEYIGFVIHHSNCAVAGACDAFDDIAAAERRLEQSSMLTLRFRYKLYSDGEKTATCRVDLKGAAQKTYQPWLARHLDRTGWVALKCLPPDDHR